MPKIVEYHIAGIKCDHCDWRNDNVKVEDFDLWLNVPCPKCRQNLLTQVDYDLSRRLIFIMKWTNRLFGWTAYFFKPKMYWSKVETNGTGEVKITTEKLPDLFKNIEDAFLYAKEIRKQRTQKVSEALRKANEKTGLFKKEQEK